MKKIHIVRLIGIVLFVVYLALIILELCIGALGDYAIYILSGVMAIVSLNMINKGVLLKSSSTLWFAITLILWAIVIMVLELCGLEERGYYYVFVLIPIISSLINVAIFRNLIYIKVIIINISIIIPVFIYRFADFNIWWVLAMGLLSIIVGIIICRMINLDKEKI